MPEAILLGCGTSNGVPALGFDYPSEFLANPKNHRTRSSLLLIGPSGNLLIDCAPEMRLQVTGVGVTRIDAVVVTHAHADHIMGMDDLRSICIRTGRAVVVYTLDEHAEVIRRVYQYAFEAFPPGVFVPRFDLCPMPEVLDVGGMSVQSFVVEHGPSRVIGLRVNAFAYITDVSRIPPEAEAKLEGLEYLVLDAVRYQPHPNHFSLSQAVATAQRIGARQTYFTHLSDDYDYDKVNAELPPGIALAYDGLRLSI